MKFFRFTTLFVLFVGVFSVNAFAQKMKAEDVIAKHLDSIATADKRAAVKTQIAVGDTVVNFITQKSQPVRGRIVLASADVKNFFGMSLDSIAYPSEKFIFDGKKSNTSVVRTGSRSVLGNFVSSNESLLQESLLGGTLSTSWALLNLDTNKAKVSFDGTKKVDGKESYLLSYTPKGGGDIDVRLYFEKDTFRHFRTEYKRVSSAGIGLRPEDSTKFSESRLKVTEDFSDFKEEGGITLPHSYRIHYSVTGQNGTTEIEWTSILSEFAINQPLDSTTFDPAAE